MINIELSSEFLNEVREAVREELEKVIISSNIQDEMMTINGVSEFIQVSVPTVRKFMNNGLPFFQEENVVRFFKSDVILWAKKNAAYIKSHEKAISA
jgi:predicted XRE-type DNA-binding protein